jgi:hypothetical protein
MELAAFFMMPYPAPAIAQVIIADLHPQHGSDLGE